MGYYTIIDETPRIKKDKIKEAREVLHKTKVVLEYYEDLDIDSEGDIRFNDYNRKCYDLELLAQALAPFTEKSRISFRGEEGEMWAFAFDGNGCWKEQKAEIKWVDC